MVTAVLMKKPTSRNDGQSRAATLKDVAALAGVSPYTVSVVLNGSKSNTRVSEETRQRIIDASGRLGYRPNVLARSLRRRSTNIIGLYFGYGHLEPHDPFHAEVLTGLQRGCELTGKDLMIHYSFHRAGIDEIFSELVGGKIDGLVMIAAPGDPLVARVKDHGLPVVAMTDAIEGLPSIIADDAGGSRKIAQHLHKKGHKVIMYRTCPGPSDSASRRFVGFCEEAEKLGIRVLESRTYAWDGTLSRDEIEMIRSRRKNGISAVVCWGDPSANALLAHCRLEQIKVPDELAIAGFNGIEPSVEPLQRLTTVRAFWSEVAQQAVQTLVERIEGRIVPILQVLKTEFTIGATT